MIEILRRKPRPPKGLTPWDGSAYALPLEDRLAYLRNRGRRPKVTRWMFPDGSWVVRHGPTKRLTRQCRQCGRWFRVTREVAAGRCRWPRYCSPNCREAAARKHDRNRRRADRGHTLTWKTFDPSHPEAYWIAQEMLDRPWKASRSAMEDAEAWLDAIESEPEDHYDGDGAPEDLY